MENRRYVYGVRIFYENGYIPMAELAFGDGGRPTGETKIIEWSRQSEREKYYFNAYTFYWDERFVPKEKTFEEFVNCAF